MQTAKFVEFPELKAAGGKRAKRQHKAENRLEPKQVEIGGKEYWRVRIGSRFTMDRSKPPIQKYFRSKVEAETFIRQQLTLLRNQGTAAFSLTDHQRVAAVNAIKALAEVGATLEEAVDYFLLHARPAGGIVIFSSGAEQFLESRRAKNCKPRYLTNLKSQCRLLGEEFGERKVNEIKKRELESWLAGRAEAEQWEPKTRNNYIVTLRAMWNHFIGEKWCIENVADPIDKAILDDVPTAIFTPDEARKLLVVASQCFDGALIPAIAIGLFAGLRRSEVCALDWSEVKESSIEVTAAKAKTRRRRIVDIQSNLADWLAPYRQSAGPVFPGNEDKFEEKRKHLAAEAKLAWPRNVLRHSAASYHLAHFASENQTALQMGHSPQVLIDHYREVVTKAAATEYWEIRPATVELDEAGCRRFGRNVKKKR
jgi:integrase